MFFDRWHIGNLAYCLNDSGMIQVTLMIPLLEPSSHERRGLIRKRSNEPKDDLYSEHVELHKLHK